MGFGMENPNFVTDEVFEATSHYAKKEEVGRGGMACIVSAQEAHLGRLVAVKVSMAGAGDENAQFLNEAEVLAKLAHPNIVPIYTRGREGHGRAFYSMKLVRGRTLQWVLEQLSAGHAETQAEYSSQRLLEIFRKVCDAVAFAHSKGYLHRDLKPENVMVGEFGEVLLMDWGLAKAFQTAGAEHEGNNGNGPLKLSYIEGSPQYMSPEQSEGIYGGLDERSDIYGLGGILYAILTKFPPVSGASLVEVLLKVRNGQVASFLETDTGRAAGNRRDTSVPRALQAVTQKAMALAPEKRYPSVGALIADIEAYQDGFITSAEEASLWKQIRLWGARHRVIVGAGALLVLIASGFTVEVIRRGEQAARALDRLRETAPTFALRAQNELDEGNYQEGLKAASFAADLEPKNSEYQALRGNALQLNMRWPEAVMAYQKALELKGDERAEENLTLMQELIAMVKTEGEAKAKGALFEALNAQGRHSEAMMFGKDLGDFWKDRNKDLSALPELVKRLEAKLLPVPGTEVFMSKTEFTVGEWKLYLRAEGLPDFSSRPSPWVQSDEHPLARVRWDQAKKFCDWFGEKTGKKWRLPTNGEWEAAVGGAEYPWGSYFPPHWDDGNYGVSGEKTDHRKVVGLDGIVGPAPVASFRPNALGFYDLGGNVEEWMWDERDGKKIRRGGNWIILGARCRTAYENSGSGSTTEGTGFRIALER